MGDAPGSAVMAVGVGAGMILRVPSRCDHATADHICAHPSDDATAQYPVGHPRRRIVFCLAITDNTPGKSKNDVMQGREDDAFVR